MSDAAFPVRIESPHGVIDIQSGMTKREWFAGQVAPELASLITLSKPDTIRIVAELCFQFADAMIAASKGEKP